MPAVKHLPPDIVPAARKRQEDSGERPSAGVPQKALNIFEEQAATSRGPRNPQDLKKERAAGVLKSEPVASMAERLARESRAQQVKLGEPSRVD